VDLEKPTPAGSAAHLSGHPPVDSQDGGGEYHGWPDKLRPICGTLRALLSLFIHPGWSVYCTRALRQLLRGRYMVESGSIEPRSRLYFRIGQTF